MSRNVILVIVAIVLLLCACCAVLGIVAFLNSSAILQQLGMAAQQQGGEAIPTALAPFPSTGKTPFPAGQATAVPTKPSGGLPSTGNPFADALNKAKTAGKYRVQFNWIFGGTTNGKYTEEPFFDFTGEVDGTNSHLVSKGGFMAMLGGDTNATIEITEAGGKSYMKGVSMFGMTDPKVWYIQKDSSTTSGFSDFTKPDYFSGFTGDNKADYKKVGTESLDAQQCDVYLYDVKSLQNAALGGLLGFSQAQGDFSAIDKGEMKVWLCGDGYVHKFTMDYQGHDSKDATQKGALKMNIHLWDFNNPTITVQAPAGAKPMPGN